MNSKSRPFQNAAAVPADRTAIAVEVADLAVESAERAWRCVLQILDEIQGGEPCQPSDIAVGRQGAETALAMLTKFRTSVDRVR